MSIRLSWAKIPHIRWHKVLFGPASLLLLAILPGLSGAQNKAYLPVQPYDTAATYTRSFARMDGQIYYGNGAGLKRTVSEKEPYFPLLSGRIEQLAKHPSGPFFFSSHDTVFVFSPSDLQRKHHGAHFQLPGCKDQYGDPIRNHVEKIAPVPESYDLVWVMGRQGIHLFERKARSSWELRRSFQNDPSQYEQAYLFLGNKVHDFYVENADRIWLGTDQGLFLLDGIQEVSAPVIADVNITAVAEPIQLDFFKQRIWVAGNRGFSDQFIWAIDYEPKADKVRIRPAQVQSFPIGSTAKGFIFDIIATERGDIWLGMEQVVRFKDIGKAEDWSFYSPESHQLFYNSEDGFEGTHALTLQEHPNGHVWVGSPEGVYTIKPGVTMDVIDQSLVTCSGKKDGRFTLRIVDGEPPYQFILDSIQVPGIRRVQVDSATIAFEGLPGGTYKILATDRLRQDTGQLNVVLEDPAPLSARLVKYRRPSYTGRRDGVVRVEAVQGGRVSSEQDFISGKAYGNYIYKWSSDRDTSESPVNSRIALGPFSVQVMDTVGCKLVLRDTFFHTLQLHELWSKSLNRSSVIRLSQLVFETDAFAIQQNHIPSLEEVRMFLKQRPDVVLEVGGHSNVVEDPAARAYLMELSLKRAEAVRSYLLEGGIPPYQVKAKGYGDERPLFEMGKKDNQRVEITILKIKE